MLSCTEMQAAGLCAVRELPKATSGTVGLTQVLSGDVLHFTREKSL